MPRPLDPSSLSPADRAAMVAYGGGGAPASPKGWRDYYQQYVSRPYEAAAPYAEKAIAGGVEALGSGDPTQPGAVSKGVANFAIPPTASDALINATSLAMPATRTLGVGRALGRSALTGLAGAGGAYAEGRSPAWGFARGAIPQAAGEAATAGAQRFVEGPMAERLTNRMADFLKKSMPWIGDVKSGEELEQAFVGGEALKKANQYMTDIKRQINRAQQGRMFHTPAIDRIVDMFKRKGYDPLGNNPLSFLRADDIISKAQNRGFRESLGIPRDSFEGEQMREAANKALKEVETLLGPHGDAFRDARWAYHSTRVLRDLFSKPEVFKGGNIDFSQLRKFARSLRRHGGSREELEGLGGFGKAVLQEAFPGLTPAFGGVAPASAHGRMHVHLPFTPFGMSVGRGGGAPPWRGVDPTKWSAAPMAIELNRMMSAHGGNPAGGP